jgi:putative DNA primase/helicase
MIGNLETYNLQLAELDRSIGQHIFTDLPDVTTSASAASWPEPQPLITQLEAEPFPIGTLPGALRAAVKEVAGFVQSPTAMVATSALGAIGIAVQGHTDVKRAERLQGPSSLYTLVIADSGERKSTTDEFFTKMLRKWDADQAERCKPAIEAHKAELAAWQAEAEGITAKIKEVAKGGKSPTAERDRLVLHQNTKPEAPKVPRLMYSDITPEELGFTMATNHPVAAISAAEGGVVLGGHGMSGDSAMRFFGMINALWSGEGIGSDRRTATSWRLDNGRLAVNLQVQAATLRNFFARGGELARGTGFLARFLVAWPKSTQGMRPFKEPPAHWPALAEFHGRIERILSKPLPMNDRGHLEPPAMMFTPEAKRLWIGYHDMVESTLGAGGDMQDVPDVASKSADNMARLACLLHVFEHGFGGSIGLESAESAAEIAIWYLTESRRFFGELALPQGQADAMRLDNWLIEIGKPTSTRDAQRLGPVRDKNRLDSALTELQELGRVRVVREGKKRLIEVNPALMVAKP